MNNIDKKILNMKRLNGSNQIGGKGSVRRKGISRNSIINKKKENNYIIEINKKILKLSESNYVKFKDFIDELAEDYINDLKRDDINKSGGLKYSQINNEGKNFIYENFFYDIKNKILLKSDIVNFINNNFKDSGKKLFYKFIESIDNILIKKEYNVNLDSEKYNKEEFNRALDFFNMDQSKKIHFKEIREKYNEIISKEKYDENTNFYYTLLRNQYNDYVNSCNN